MKVYLSKCWIGNYVATLIAIVILVVLAIVLCAQCIMSEIFEVIPFIPLYVLVMLAFPVYILHSAIGLIRYVTEAGGKIVMMSFRGKELGSITLNADIYYEKVALKEGLYSKQDFMVLSNFPFHALQGKELLGLATACDVVDKNGSQIIMPCKDNPYVSKLLSSQQCHRIW